MKKGCPCHSYQIVHQIIYHESKYSHSLIQAVLLEVYTPKQNNSCVGGDDERIDSETLRMSTLLDPKSIPPDQFKWVNKTQHYNSFIKIGLTSRLFISISL